MEQDNFDLIEKYVSGAMNTAEAESFKAILQTDKALAKEVDFYKQVATVAMWKGALEEADADLIKEEEKVPLAIQTTKETAKVAPIQPKAKVRQLGIRRLLSYAASVGILLIAAGAWFANTTYSNAALMDLKDNKLALSASAVRGINEVAGPFAPGLKALNEKDFTSAIIFFETINIGSDHYAEARLYLSYLTFQQKQYEQTLIHTHLVNGTGNIEQQQKAEWLQLQALLALDQTDASFDQLVEKIASDEQHLFQKEAIKLRTSINSIWHKVAF